MAVGLAATDAELAIALFEQCCFDLRNGERTFDAEIVGAKALALGQFQQCCEKALKAVTLMKVGRIRYGQEVRPTHRVWSGDLQDGRLTEARQAVEGLLRSLARYEQPEMVSAALTELEGYAPRMSWESANPEYPWVEQGVVHAPAQFFAAHELEVGKFGKLARSIVTRTASGEPKFSKTWSAVKSETTVE